MHKSPDTEIAGFISICIASSSPSPPPQNTDLLLIFFLAMDPRTAELHTALELLNNALSLAENQSFIWSPLEAHELLSGICCQLCQSMFSVEGLKALRSGGGYMHYTNSMDCRAAAEKGCSICRYIWNRAGSRLPVAIFAECNRAIPQYEDGKNNSEGVFTPFDTLRATHVRRNDTKENTEDLDVEYGLTILTLAVFAFPG